MAISLDASPQGDYRARRDKVVASQDGTEVIFKLDPRLKTTLHVIPSSAAYMPKLSAQDSDPVDFTGFAPVSTTDYTDERVMQFASGLTYIGVDVTSGSCTVYVTQS